MLKLGGNRGRHNYSALVPSGSVSLMSPYCVPFLNVKMWPPGLKPTLCNSQERTEPQVLTSTLTFSGILSLTMRAIAYVKVFFFLSPLSDTVSHSFRIVSLISVSVVLFQLPVQVEVIGDLDSEPLTSKPVANGQSSLWAFKLSHRAALHYNTPGPCIDGYFMSLLLILPLSLGHLWRRPEDQSRREKLLQHSLLTMITRHFCLLFMSLYC